MSGADPMGQQYSTTLRAKAVVSAGPDYETVQDLADLIAAGASRDKPAFEWQVTPLRDRERNAYCLPGGKIVVYTDILPLTCTDAGLATVLAHVKVAALLGAGAKVGGSFPWSWRQESQADHIGLIYMAQAGYRPQAAVTFWRRMHVAQRDGTPPVILSDHPSSGDRVEDIQGWMPEAERAFR